MVCRSLRCRPTRLSLRQAFCVRTEYQAPKFHGRKQGQPLRLAHGPRLQITFGGHDSFRDPQEIDAESFIGVKSFKAKGKRLTTFDTETITELEPIRRPEPETEEAVAGETEEKDTEKENLDPDAGKSQSDIVDELTGQMKLFEDE